MSIRTSIFMSLDNRIDASSDWHYPFFDEEFFGVLAAEWDRANAFLIGARSFSGYEKLAEEHPESPMVSLLTTKPVIVPSSARDSSDVYDHAIFVGDLEPKTVASIEDEHGEVLVLGSATSIVTMIENRALHTLNLTVIPTVVGHGPTLFATATRPIRFQTTEARVLASGVTLLDLAVMEESAAAKSPTD